LVELVELAWGVEVSSRCRGLVSRCRGVEARAQLVGLEHVRVFVELPAGVTAVHHVAVGAEDGQAEDERRAKGEANRLERPM